MSQYYSLVTNAGKNALIKALANHTNINLTTMSVGDSTEPLNALWEALPNEKHKFNINAIYPQEDDPNVLIVEGAITADVGGFVINQVAVFDENGVMFAIAQVPSTIKPLLNEGAAKDMSIRFYLAVENASSINIKVDNSVVLATRTFVNNEIDKLNKIYLKKTDKIDAYTKQESNDKFALKSDITNATEEKAGIVKLKNSVTGKAEDVAVTEKAVVDYMKKEISINGNATFDNVKNNIVMSGIGSITLAVGDVIEVKGTSSNDKLFTVESIVSNDEIIVNYEHRGTSTPAPSKRLIKETAQNCVIKLYCRAKEAPLGLGQGWCEPASGRSGNVNYHNNTQRTIAASFYVASYSLNRVSLGVYLDDIPVSAMMTDGSSMVSSSTTLVPPNSVLKVSVTPNKWTEFR
ncbi:phage tail protein [Campylobacter hyointestinalis]|uniref:phage tail protein n=1 Tax=Campylobacter hyointestinalis TaxID=198 RepID=UPI00072903E2|nr:phage tail protein [Campylobacter hyointestinalis]CUU72227.1 tail fiber protein H [Campylobacter hyointestinalis subsp. hyointestinalis]